MHNKVYTNSQHTGGEKASQKRILIIISVMITVMMMLTFVGNDENKNDAALSESINIPLAICTGDLKRLGSEIDGGWYTCLPFDWKPLRDSCIAYSFGIKDDYSFDEAILRLGCDVHGFDPSPFGLNSKPAYEALGAKYHDYGLGPQDKSFEAGEVPFNWPGINYLKDSNTEVWQLKTLKSIFHHFQPKNAAKKVKYSLVKIDVEGAEWDAMNDLVTSTDWDQLLIELHFPPAFYTVEKGQLEGFQVSRVKRNKLSDMINPPKYPKPRYDYIHLLQELAKVSHMWHWNFNIKQSGVEDTKCIEAYFSRVFGDHDDDKER